MEPKNNSMTHSKKQTTHRKIERNGSIVVLPYKTPGKKKKKKRGKVENLNKKKYIKSKENCRVI
jgi:hypothetical protein